MVNSIEQDHQRFRQIVRGAIRRDLRRFISRGDILAREGGRVVSVPIHDIDIPTFRYGDNSGGVGMGEGEEGQSVGQGQGQAQGGDAEGRHAIEVDVALDELADILADELKLPRIQPRGRHELTTIRDKYTGIRPIGPAALRHFKRTYREALRRQLSMGLYDPDNPVIIPIKNDLRFRSWNEVKKPQSNAVIVYMMDVSGSMGDEQKELVRLEAFWIDTWLRRNYQGIESRYIVHDVRAAEVDRKTFFSIREDGGTRISSAYHACHELLQRHYDNADWNIYLFHFSDGDNSSDADNRLCVKVIDEQLLPRCNMFGYCQVASSYGSGSFINVLHEAFPDGRPDDLGPRVVTSKVNGRDDVLESLRTFFKQGR
ncbi:MAG: DUF444 family protein [Phycisphaeraceae bacterium]|nr:DUF444 family protein [Phycisphaerae bacterium]MBX3391896.1 DUF444 family protein [Phycisphaeraceae bacterium]HRJ50564.1 DUF444 family protein [Phycisphaerales bacterium]